MQGKHLFEYAVIRVMPRVEREEFLNAGVILYCSALKYLDAKIFLHEERLTACCAEIDFSELEENMQSIRNISAAKTGSGPIGLLDMASRFRWLTATRSTMVQSSKVHSGFCDDPAEMLSKLFDQLVR